MKNKLFLIVTLVALLIAMCMSGCEMPAGQNKGSHNKNADGQSITIVGGENQDADLENGSFQSIDTNDSEKSNAKELGGSSTLDIEYPEDETKPEQGDTSATEPQWQPGIW